MYVHVSLLILLTFTYKEYDTFFEQQHFLKFCAIRTRDILVFTESGKPTSSPDGVTKRPEEQVPVQIIRGPFLTSPLAPRGELGPRG
jgi:hypothetical protein